MHFVDIGIQTVLPLILLMVDCGSKYPSDLLTVGPGVSDTEFLSENPGF